MKQGKPTLGIVTIGQAPRVDLHEDLFTLLGDNVNLLEMGALDGLDLSTIQHLYPVQHSDHVLVSRMQDGQQVRIKESDLTPLLSEAVRRMQQQQPDLIIVLCTGDLPDFANASGVVVISPKRVVHHFFAGLTDKLSIAVMSPDEAQVDNTRQRWLSQGFKVQCLAGSPYLEDGGRDDAADQLKQMQADIVYLDCMGYTLEQKQQIAQRSGKSVITPREIIFNTVKLLLNLRT